MVTTKILDKRIPLSVSTIHRRVAISIDDTKDYNIRTKNKEDLISFNPSKKCMLYCGEVGFTDLQSRKKFDFYCTDDSFVSRIGLLHSNYRPLHSQLGIMTDVYCIDFNRKEIRIGDETSAAQLNKHSIPRIPDYKFIIIPLTFSWNNQTEQHLSLIHTSYAFIGLPLDIHQRWTGEKKDIVVPEWDIRISKDLIVPVEGDKVILGFPFFEKKSIAYDVRSFCIY